MTGLLNLLKIILGKYISKKWYFMLKILKYTYLYSGSVYIVQGELSRNFRDTESNETIQGIRLRSTVVFTDRLGLFAVV
ncbi:hypothetical protein GCM10028804_13590 [Larkinella terrae]